MSYLREIALFAQKYGLEAASTEYGFSVPTIWRYAKDEGVALSRKKGKERPPSHWTVCDSLPAQIVRAIVLDRKTVREAMSDFKVGQEQVYRALRRWSMKTNGQKRCWSKSWPCCTNPSCKHTKSGVTTRPHNGNGLCRSCSRKKKYREDFAHREKLLARARAHALTYQPKNRAPDKSGSRARYSKLRIADGFRQDVQTGMLVSAPWAHNYYGQPIPMRVLRRYAQDGEAMCDLDDGKKLYTQVPMSSLTLVVESPIGRKPVL